MTRAACLEMASLAFVLDMHDIGVVWLDIARNGFDQDIPEEYQDLGGES